MRIEKKLINLDTSRVDFDNGEWGWSRGGHPLRDDQYAISYIPDDGELTETRYALPDCINEMLNKKEQLGAKEARRKMRMALQD